MRRSAPACLMVTRTASAQVQCLSAEHVAHTQPCMGFVPGFVPMANTKALYHAQRIQSKAADAPAAPAPLPPCLPPLPPLPAAGCAPPAAAGRAPGRAPGCGTARAPCLRERGRVRREIGGRTSQGRGAPWCSHDKFKSSSSSQVQVNNRLSCSLRSFSNHASRNVTNTVEVCTNIWSAACSMVCASVPVPPDHTAIEWLAII